MIFYWHPKQLRLTYVVSHLYDQEVCLCSFNGKLNISRGKDKDNS